MATLNNPDGTLEYQTQKYIVKNELLELESNMNHESIHGDSHI
jgi:hypothetical protein